MTIKSFVNLAKAGKYNNSLFSKVTKDFMVNGGYCGTSSYGEAFEDEFCDRLFNIRGAVAMSNTGADTNESAFFINQKTAETYKNEGGWEHLASQWDSIKTQLANYKDSNLLTAFIEKNGTNCYDTDSVPDSVKKLYEENGGNAYLDGAYNAVDRGYTVFAQVIDGMDVVDSSLYCVILMLLITMFLTGMSSLSTLAEAILSKALRLHNIKRNQQLRQIRHLPKASHSRPQSDKERL